MTFGIIVAIITFFWIYYTFRYNNSKTPWLLIILTLSILLISRFLSLYDTMMFLLLTLIIIGPFLIIPISRKTTDREIKSLLSWSIYIYIPLSFLLFSMILIKIVENHIENLFFSEIQFINFFIFAFIIATAIYSLSLLFKIYTYVSEYDHKIIKLRLPLMFIYIISVLLIPDALIAYSSFDLYLSLYKGEEFSFFDRFYYSFSIHYLTPITDKGELIQKLFLSSKVGISIYIFHILTIRIIDVTIIASIHNLLRTQNKNEF